MRDYGEAGCAVQPNTPTLMNDIAVLVERAENVRSHLADIKGRLFGFEPTPAGIGMKEDGGNTASHDVQRACRALNDAQEMLAALESRLGEPGHRRRGQLRNRRRRPVARLHRAA